MISTRLMKPLAGTKAAAHSLPQRSSTPRPSAAREMVSRSPSCACGGGCPRCGDNGARRDTIPRLDGVPAMASLEEAGGTIAIDALPSSPALPSPGSAPPQGGAAAPRCPTNIRVAEIVEPPLTSANVTQGFHSGWGGIARMVVSDPTGRDWAGTAIHENIVSGTNTCQPGTAACPNTHGQGGAAGSTFVVGRALSSPGYSLPSLPAQTNSFYDLHIFGMGVSILHDQSLPACEQMCSQVYDCGGRIFGPTFTIHRTMTRDQISSGGTPVDITRVGLEKPQNPSELGDFPEPNLPPGTQRG